MAVTVRWAEPTDLETIIEFNCFLARESEGKELDLSLLRPGIAAALADRAKGPYLLAEEQGIILGQMAITFEWSDWRNGWFWWVQSVYVRPEARRRGVFTALFHHLEKEAGIDRTVIGIRLYVEEENHTAIQTYLKLNFKRTGYRVLEKYPLP